MDIFFEAMLSMPTAIYSAGMAIVALYWVFVVVGALDIDLISFDGPDFDLDVDLDVDVDPNLEIGHHGLLHSTMEILGIGTVPITIVFSLIVSSGWLTGIGLEVFIWPLVSPFTHVLLFAIAEFIIMFFLSIKVAALCIIPLKTSLKIQTIHGQEHLIGKIITVTSGEVTEKLGNGSYTGADCTLTLNIRLKESNGDTNIQKHQEVIISDYNKDKNIYYIQEIDLPKIDTQKSETLSLNTQETTIPEGGK